MTAALRDVDGDLVRDLAIGASNELRVYSGKDFSVLFDLVGRSADGYVLSVTSMPDANGDGRDELIAGFPADQGNRGLVFEYAGSACLAAGATSYGSGWAGTRGVPEIGVDRTPELCQTIRVSFQNSERCWSRRSSPCRSPSRRRADSRGSCPSRATRRSAGPCSSCRR